MLDGYAANCYPFPLKNHIPHKLDPPGALEESNDGYPHFVTGGDETDCNLTVIGNQYCLKHHSLTTQDLEHLSYLHW